MNTFGSVFLSVPATMSAPGQSSKPWNISPSSFGAHNSVSNGNGCKTPPNSPWGTHNLAGLSRGHNVMTLEEVMSEQLADQLQLHNSPLAPVAVLAAAVDESTSFPNTGWLQTYRPIEFLFYFVLRSLHLREISF